MPVDQQEQVQQKRMPENNLFSVDQSEYSYADASVKPLSKPVGPKKLLLLPNVESRKSVVNVKTGCAGNLSNPGPQVATSGMLAVLQPNVQPTGILPATASRMLIVKIIPRSIDQVEGVPRKSRMRAVGFPVSTVQTEQLMMVSKSNVENQAVMINGGSLVGAALGNQKSLTLMDIEDSNYNSGTCFISNVLQLNYDCW